MSVTRGNIREAVINMLEDTIEKNDYMSLVAVQLRIKSKFYEEHDMKAAAKDVEFLKNYKKSYPHISRQIDEVIDYLNGIAVMNAMGDSAE